MKKESSKKLCIFLPSHFTHFMGGSEYQAKLLIDKLSQLGMFQITYLCRNWDNKYIPKGYKINGIAAESRFKFLNLYIDLFKSYQELKKINPDIVYQNVGSAFTGAISYYAKKNKAKFVWHAASDDDLKPQWSSNVKRSIMKSIDRVMLNYGIKNATKIATQTHFQDSLLKKRFNRESDVIVPVGHPLPTNATIKNDIITVVWVANIKPLKQPEIFVDLATEVGKKCNAKFIMIGRPGWGKSFNSLMSKIKNTKNLEYLGELSQEEVNQYLDKSHILVNTSLYEGFSNTFVQAWMRGMPVVSLSVDPDRILQKNNIGILSGNFKRLCKDVSFLIYNKDHRIEMGEKAKKYSFLNHSVDQMVEKVLELLI